MEPYTQRAGSVRRPIAKSSVLSTIYPNKRHRRSFRPGYPSRDRNITSFHLHAQHRHSSASHQHSGHWDDVHVLITASVAWPSPSRFNGQSRRRSQSFCAQNESRIVVSAETCSVLRLVRARQIWSSPGRWAKIMRMSSGGRLASALGWRCGVICRSCGAVR